MTKSCKKVNMKWTSHLAQGWTRIAGAQQPRSFDLNVRSKKLLDPHIQSYITDIYLLNQNLSGVRGALAIEQQDF